MRVLIVDDEEMIRDSLADYLEDDGFQVWTASSGEEGLRVLSRERMECCVVDMRLPGMNGDEFVVKASRMQIGLRFVIHTGSNEYRLSKPLLGLGIQPDDLFYKPVSDQKSIADRLRSLRPQ
jgi:DNA-binding response OmpR family regulator